MMRFILLSGFACLAFLFTAVTVSAQEAKSVHGLSIYGDLKYPANFENFDYVNAEAPKGGILKMGATGSFDNLNPFIIKGDSAVGLGLTVDTLLEGSKDEAFSEYGLLVESIVMPADRSSVEFTLRKEAKWHDGKQITADDVIWSFNTLREKGSPFYKSYYADVKSVTSNGPQNVKFEFNSGVNKELPLIVGQIPVLPKHYWTKEGNDFSKTTLVAPLASGPYKIKQIIPGRKIVYERVKDWWAKDLPIAKGRYNFDEIHFDYYRDDSVELQAFLSGEYDLRQENTAKTWATGYTGKGVKTAQIKLEEIPNELPTGMQAFIYNIRKPVFQDIEVRKALSYAFDFEWSNKQFAYDAYRRTESYFSNSELASYALPEGRELEILEEFKAQLPAELFTKEFFPPKTDGTGNNRRNIRLGTTILEEAGWKLGEDKIRIKNGVKLQFEIIINNPAFERWLNPFVQNLQHMGVKATLRVLDTAQYKNRMDAFDYDMTVGSFGQSSSPGNEQRDFWHSEKASINGSRNLIGIQNPVVDQLIDLVIAAPDRDELVARTRALDRVLLWNYYLIPNWHINVWRVAYWDKFGIPAAIAPYDLGVTDTWWTDPAKQKTLLPKVE